MKGQNWVIEKKVIHLVKLGIGRLYTFYLMVFYSLGGTRFMKVASATHSDGTEVVVKVFAKHEPLQLENYKKRLLEILKKLQGVANALPFQHCWVSE